MKQMVTLVVVLLFAAVAHAGELGGVQGTLLVGAYAGYGFGFGDEFKESKRVLPLETLTAQLKPGVNFGGEVFYGIGDRLFLGLTADFLRMKNKHVVESTGDLLGETHDLSDYEMWIALNLKARYFLPPTGSLCPYFEAGPGLYLDPDDRAGGLAGGIGAFYELGHSLALDAGIRLHVLFGMSTVSYAEVHVGIGYALIGIDK